MNGFEKRTERIKKRIREATLELLSTLEPRSLRITDVVERAKVSQVTIYKHFESKENLVHEALKGWYIESLEEIEQYLEDPTKDFQEKVSFIIFHEKNTLSQFNLTKLNELLWHDHEMKAFVEEIQSERLLPVLVHLIEQGKKENVIHHAFPSSLIMLYMDVFTNQTELFARYANDHKNEEDFVEHLTELFFYGLAGKRQ